MAAFDLYLALAPDPCPGGCMATTQATTTQLPWSHGPHGPGPSWGPSDPPNGGFAALGGASLPPNPP